MLNQKIMMQGNAPGISKQSNTSTAAAEKPEPSAPSESSGSIPVHLSPEELQKVYTLQVPFERKNAAGEQEIVMASHSRLSDWIVLLTFSKDSISQDLILIRRIFYAGLILYVLFFTYLSYVLSRRLSKPLKELTAAINKVGAIEQFSGFLQPDETAQRDGSVQPDTETQPGNRKKPEIKTQPNTPDLQNDIKQENISKLKNDSTQKNNIKQESLEPAGKREIDISVNKNHIDEIKQLSLSFNSMTRRIDNLLIEVKQTEQAKRRAYMQTLQLQLTPHFLYNSLNSIRWMAQINGQHNIVEVSKALILYLKSLTDIESEYITLEGELMLIDAYATIQRYRFRDFSLSYDVPRELHGVYIHKLMILNLVENSIIHGFNDKQEPGEVFISARVNEHTGSGSRTEPDKGKSSVESESSRESKASDGKSLLITVSDNGAGIALEKLEKINGMLAQEYDYTEQESGKSGAHIGLFNIQSRLHLYHGADYGVSVNSEPGKGCEVRILQPLIYQGDL